MDQPTTLKIFIVNQQSLNANNIEFIVVRCGNDGETE